MIAQRLREFLDRNGVRYEVVPHEVAYTAHRTAKAAHVHGRAFAKSVVFRLDGRPVVAVVPATRTVDPDRLAAAADAGAVEVLPETEFAGLFPGCEPGAMPPFGHLYGMDVFADRALADEPEIAFNAGSHTDLIRMPSAEYLQAAQPVLGEISDAGRAADAAGTWP